MQVGQRYKCARIRNLAEFSYRSHAAHLGQSVYRGECLHSKRLADALHHAIL
jgi:hypothetical protein